jgi:NADPH-dependent 7-cyano-7-deazaguanine reductase QueF-like protein
VLLFINFFLTQMLFLNAKRFKFTINSFNSLVMNFRYAELRESLLPDFVVCVFSKCHQSHIACAYGR